MRTHRTSSAGVHRAGTSCAPLRSEALWFASVGCTGGHGGGLQAVWVTGLTYRGERALLAHPGLPAQPTRQAAGGAW